MVWVALDEKKNDPQTFPLVVAPCLTQLQAIGDRLQRAAQMHTVGSYERLVERVAGHPDELP